MAYPQGGGGGGYGYPQQPQGGYGAPQYPPQHGGYQQPPPQGYGAPYGAPPPGAPYGAPPPQQPPPPHHAGGYGGYGQPAAYGAPPQQQALIYLGTPVPPAPPQAPAPPPPGYNVLQDVERIRKACKGFGTDEKALIEVLAPLDAYQVDALYHQYKATTGKDLLAQLEGETSGWFEAALRAKVLGPVGYDVWLVHRACDGAGTHEDALTEVLMGRTNAEMWALKQAYRAKYGQDMEKVVEGELSLKTKRMFVMAMQGQRQEDWAPVDPNMVANDVKELKAAARGAGTDEIKICGILLSRSTPHLRAIAQTYGSHVGSLAKMVSSEFSGHMKDALLHVVTAVDEGNPQNPPGVARDARLLEDSMKGLGTKDERLVYRLFRAHWDRRRFEAVKSEFAHTHSKRGLRARVEGETSGDYKRFLSAVIGH